MWASIDKSTYYSLSAAQTLESDNRDKQTLLWFMSRRGATRGGHERVLAPPHRKCWYFSSWMALGIGHMEMFHINRESDAFDNPMLHNSCKEFHCIALHCCDWVMHHYSRSTSAGMFMARLHTIAIFCSCQFLIFDSPPTFRHLAYYFELDRRAGASPRPPSLWGPHIREMRA